MVTHMMPIDLYSFFFNNTATTEIYTYGHTLSRPDALPIFGIDFTLGTVMSTLVNPLLLGLDAVLLAPITELLGINVTGADITPIDVECDGTGVELVG